MKFQILISVAICLTLSLPAWADEEWEDQFARLIDSGLDGAELIDNLRQLNGKFPDYKSANRKQANELVKLSDISINKCNKLYLATELNWPARLTDERLNSMACYFRDQQMNSCIKYFEVLMQTDMRDIGDERELQLRSLARAMLKVQQAGAGGDLDRQAMQRGIMIYLRQMAPKNAGEEKALMQQYDVKLIRLCKIVEDTKLSLTVTPNYMRIHKKDTVRYSLDDKWLEIARGADICHSILMNGDSLRDEIQSILRWTSQKQDTVPT